MSPAPATAATATTFVGGVMSILENDAGVAAIVGSNDAARIYAPVLPIDATLPAIAVQKISDPRTAHSHDEATSGVLRKTRVQVSCWGSGPGGYLDAVELAAAVMAVLGGWTGTIASKRVGRTHIDNDMDDHDPDTGWDRVIVDVIFTNEAPN